MFDYCNAESQNDRKSNYSTFCHYPVNNYLHLEHMYKRILWAIKSLIAIFVLLIWLILLIQNGKTITADSLHRRIGVKSHNLTEIEILTSFVTKISHLYIIYFHHMFFKLNSALIKKLKFNISKNKNIYCVFVNLYFRFKLVLSFYSLHILPNQNINFHSISS